MAGTLTALAWVVLLASGHPGGGSEPPPRWWAEQGAPELVQIQEETFARRGVPYMYQRVYVDAQGYRRKAKGGGDLLGPLREGKVWIGIRGRFLVAAGPEARRDILTRLLNRVWTGPGTFAQDPEGQALLDLTSHTIEEGDEVDYLYGPSGTMWVRYGSEAPHVFRSPALSRAMLALDFQFDPDNRKSLDSLREALKALRHPPPRRP